MAEIELIEIESCVDCVYASGTGETPEGAEFEPLSKLYQGDTVSFESDDPGFSWSECNTCNSKLGGDRYGGTIARRL